MSEEKDAKISSAESERTGIAESVMSARIQPLRVAITGATGFIGSALASGLESDCAVIALGRRYASATKMNAHTDLSVPGIVRRRCDLFSIEQTRDALENADVAVYLVHSMSPQGSRRVDSKTWISCSPTISDARPPKLGSDASSISADYSQVTKVRASLRI